MRDLFDSEDGAGVMSRIFPRVLETIRFGRDRTKPTVVTFTGGMGAQLISAAIYFSMKQSGQSVYADLSYFDKPESVAQAGHPGQCSHWAWQLDLFGLNPKMFAVNPGLYKRNAIYIEDGPQKLELALEALAQPEVRVHFKIKVQLDDVLPGMGAENFLCIHVRRGDYVNVASHLVEDDTFIDLAKKFVGLVDHVIVLSDSPINAAFRSEISPYFKMSDFIDNSDSVTSHYIMRMAKILICSNSQFSLAAAALNPDALVIIPKQWFGSEDRSIEVPLHTRCAYQIMQF